VLQVDAMLVFERLTTPGDIVLARLGHARRKFYDLHERRVHDRCRALRRIANSMRSRVNPGPHGRGTSACAYTSAGRSSR